MLAFEERQLALMVNEPHGAENCPLIAGDFPAKPELLTLAGQHA